jgi:hypothetical protein
MNNQNQHHQPRTQCMHGAACTDHSHHHRSQYWHHLCNHCFRQGHNLRAPAHPATQCINWNNPAGPNFRPQQAPVQLHHHVPHGQGQAPVLVQQLHHHVPRGQGQAPFQVLHPQLQVQVPVQVQAAALQAQQQAAAHACAARHLVNEAHRMAAPVAGGGQVMAHPGLAAMGLVFNPFSAGLARR